MKGEPSDLNTERYNLLYRSEVRISEIREKLDLESPVVNGYPQMAKMHVRQAILLLDMAHYNLFFAREILGKLREGPEA